MSGYIQVHLFCGIGGWPLALKMVGWPEDMPVWTGSCPCQPFSQAGDRRGEEDERHLWPIMRELLTLWYPPVCFGEQVASSLGREWLARVRADLEAMDYAVGAADLCAAGASAPHIRQRLFWVADAESGRRREQRGEDHARDGGHAHGGSKARGVEHPDSIGRRGTRVQNRRQGETSGAGQTGLAIGGLGNSQSIGRSPAEGHQHKDQEGPTDQRPEGLGELPLRSDGSSGTGSIGGLGNADDEGSQRRSIGRDSGSQQPAWKTSLGCPWDHFDVVECKDDKLRRIECGTFPLVDGFPGRVGLLRGYGNAINPYVAAQFIQAYAEAKDLVG